ncbi:MAG: N-acetyl-gamma-glutamyl-phosphate reductase [Candidatus Adiutrix sp.]
MNIGILGASGYTGVELLRLLANHPGNLTVSVVSSRKTLGMRLCDVFPELSAMANYDDLLFENPEDELLPSKADFFFLATPHGVAMGLAPKLLKAGAKVIDLSADFRLKNLNAFEQWYGPHLSPNLIGEAVYGLSELYGPQIKAARLVANPGCYPTSIILALAPLLATTDLLNHNLPIIADCASGISGAGRKSSLSASFCENFDSFKAYSVLGHRHTPEIEEQLSKIFGQPLGVSFTPHLLPMSRGILSTIYVSPQTPVSQQMLDELYQNFYASHHFVRVRPFGFEPQTSQVRGTNFCDLAVYHDARLGLIKIISAIDNLCRGAAGQALVNFNLMTSHHLRAGLDLLPLRP